MHVGRIVWDVAVSFDCVHHEILLAKLHFSGLKEYLKIGSGPI
jgi:hypothetical protein